MMIIGVIWFSIGSLICGLAPNLSALIAARIFQGIGGALMTPASLAILETVFAPDDRARAIGAWSGLSSAAAAIAPFLGGYLVDAVSWRLVFLINLPLAALVLWVSSKHVPETESFGERAPLDLLGSALGAVGLAGLTYASIEAPALGGTSPAVVGAAAIGLISLAVFLFVEAHASNPILPLRIFRARQFSGTNLVTLVLYAALGAAFFLLPIQLQGGLGYSALQAGIALLPVTGMMLLLSSRFGAWSQLRGARMPMTLGPLAVGVAFVLLSYLAPTERFTMAVLPGVLVLGFALALTVPPLTATALASAPIEFSGTASAINNQVADFGALIAIALLPFAAGLSGHSLNEPAALSIGFRHAMLICAALAGTSGLLSFLLIQNRTTAVQPQRLCALEAPPLQTPELSMLEKPQERATTLPAEETVALLDGGAAAYPRMLTAIREAQNSIHLEVYTFADDRIGRSFIDALKESAGAGVQCTVILDGWGSARSGRRIARILRDAGCQVFIYNRLMSLLLGRFRRDHRKILVVDGRIAFVGGINIGEEYASTETRAGWADLALELRGRPAAWLAMKLRGERRLPRQHATRIFLSGLAGGGHLRKRYLRALARAQRGVLFAHSYFLPDERLIRALTAAARRGVSVTLLLAGTSDVPFVRAATMRLYRRLLDSGVVIYEWINSVLHAKVAVVDGTDVLLGSFNLDPLSLANLEVLAEVQDPTLVHETEAWVRARIHASRRVGAADCGSPIQNWLMERLGYWAAKLTEHIARFIARSRPYPRRV
jgi:EmrB/QacA subfamily drug resistance transporter